MKRFREVMIGCAAIVVGAAAARAQVGVPPARSPFIDIDATMEFTPLFGFFSAKANVSHEQAKEGD